MQVAEVQLIYRSKVKAIDRPKIITSQDAYGIFLEFWNPNTIELFEEFKILLLNRANRVIGIYHLSSGGTSMTIVDKKLVLVAALKAVASAIILCHNHPTQSLTPSEGDKQITRQLVEGCKLLDMRVLDHLVICSEGYFSFADEGLL